VAGDVTFFPVGNGDMTLVRLADAAKTTVMIDCRIRQPGEGVPDVAAELRERLERDAQGRPYVDVFLLSHPDQDHCLGFKEHFWTGPLADYPDDEKDGADKRIVIRELWSSPLVFRRAKRKKKGSDGKEHVLCADAQAFDAEARRRVNRNKAAGFKNIAEGDRILILGHDIDGKADDLGPIRVDAGQLIPRINGAVNAYAEIQLIAPREPHDDDTENELSKNDSSVIINLHLAARPGEFEYGRFLTGGDAGVLIWERLWNNHPAERDHLRYHLLQAPHHCSWHSLSYDSASECDDPKVNTAARNALGQAESGAFIVASSKPIDDDECDPPSHLAKTEYQAILKKPMGRFYCTGEHRTRKNLEPFVLEITPSGFRLPTPTGAAMGIAAAAAPRAGQP
jgi:hypothetical protein